MNCWDDWYLFGIPVRVGLLLPLDADHAEEADQPLGVGLGDEAALVRGQRQRVPALQRDQLIVGGRCDVDLELLASQTYLEPGKKPTFTT